MAYLWQGITELSSASVLQHFVPYCFDRVQVGGVVDVVGRTSLSRVLSCHFCGVGGDMKGLENESVSTCLYVQSCYPPTYMCDGVHGIRIRIKVLLRRREICVSRRRTTL